MATLYFNGAVADENGYSDWNVLDNWWLDSSFSTPATNLPTSSDDVIIGNNLNTYVIINYNTGSEPTVANLILNLTALYIPITVTGQAIFNGCLGGGAGSHFASATITVNGGAEFNDCSYAQGILNGNATFNDNAYHASEGHINGNATFNGASYNTGTVTGAIVCNTTSTSGNCVSSARTLYFNGAADNDWNTIGSYATGSISFSGQPADGDTLTIDSIVFEFDNDSSVSGGHISVTIGANLASTLSMLEGLIENNTNLRAVFTVNASTIAIDLRGFGSDANYVISTTSSVITTGDMSGGADGNWWLDDLFSIPAISLPSTIDNVIAYANILSGGPQTVNNISMLYNGIDNATLDIEVTVYNMATFEQAGNLGVNGILHGSATFYGSENNGSVFVPQSGLCLFNHNARNKGTVNGKTEFNDTSSNGAYPDIYGIVDADSESCTFKNGSLNFGSVTASNVLFTGAAGISYPSDNSRDVYADTVVFANGATNGYVTQQGVVYLTSEGTCTFNGCYNNSGPNETNFGGKIVDGTTIFNDASNYGEVDGDAIFNNSINNNDSYNPPYAGNGRITGNATFNGTSYNLGTIIGDGTFNGNSTNSTSSHSSQSCDPIVEGRAEFREGSVNYGSAPDAHYYDSSFNASCSLCTGEGWTSTLEDRQQYPIPRGINGSSILGII
jgi:hypothetical protein